LYHFYPLYIRTKEKGAIVMKKLIPILLTIFMLLGVQVALGSAVVKMSGSGVISPAAYQLISDGQCHIVNNGNGTIGITGSTSTNYVVKEIGVIISLQYYSGGKWSTLSSYSYNNSNSDYVFGGKGISVQRGYNYRVTAQHTALNGTVNESGQSYSESIYVQ